MAGTLVSIGGKTQCAHAHAGKQSANRPRTRYLHKVSAQDRGEHTTTCAAAEMLTTLFQLETIQMSLHRRTDKQIKAYPHKRTLLSNRTNAQETAMAPMGLRAVELCQRTLPAGFPQREARTMPGLISRGRKRSGHRLGQRWGGRGLTQKEHKGALEGDGNTLSESTALAIPRLCKHLNTPRAMYLPSARFIVCKLSQ